MRVLRSLKDQRVIKVITGVRRSGKSTLLEMFADELRRETPDAPVQSLNFEDPKNLALGDWGQIYNIVHGKLHPDRMNYVFLDEVQNIAGFERLVDGLYIQKNIDLYITGSNAWLLSSELATLLTGRYIEINILPFSFAEYVGRLEMVADNQKNTPSSGQTTDSINSPNLAKNGGLGNLSGNPQLINGLSKHEILATYVANGGIPQSLSIREADKEQADEFLRGMINTIVEKDIFSRHEIFNKPTFQKILDFVMDSIGSPISPRSIAGTLRSERLAIDHKTVSVYLDYLTSAFLLYKVPRYDVKGRDFLRTLDKYYLVDTGFRNARLPKDRRSNIGHLLENTVYLELRRRYRSVFVGKLREHEIDFVATDTDGYTTYFQVAQTALEPSTLERELKPLAAVRDSNPKYLLTMDIDDNPVFNGIRKLNIAEWLLANPA